MEAVEHPWHTIGGDAQMRRPQPDDRAWPGSTGTARPSLPRAAGRIADLLAGSHARRRRSATGIFVVISLLSIGLNVPHVPLPSPPAADHGSRAGRAGLGAGVCWVVEAVAARANRQTLAEGRATLRKAGLPVQIWRGGRGIGTQPRPGDTGGPVRQQGDGRGWTHPHPPVGVQGGRTAPPTTLGLSGSEEAQ
jgi:hypothetical protein